MIHRKTQKVPQKRMLSSPVTYQFSALSFFPAEEQKNPSTLQKRTDLGDGVGSPASCPAQASLPLTAWSSARLCEKEADTATAFTVLDSSGTCRVSIYIYIMDITEGKTSQRFRLDQDENQSFLSEASSTSIPRWPLNGSKTKSSLQHWQSEDV